MFCKTGLRKRFGCYIMYYKEVILCLWEISAYAFISRRNPADLFRNASIVEELGGNADGLEVSETEN